MHRAFLRANPIQAGLWDRLKFAAAAASNDLAEYDAIKEPARALLMELAEQWAARTTWAPEHAPT